MGSEQWLKLALVLCGMCCYVHGAGLKGDPCGSVYGGGSGTITLPTEECVEDNVTYSCYRQDFECQYIIEGAVNDVIMLNSDDFFLEESDDCIFDYVEIIEGQDQAGTRFCGTKRLRTISNINKLTINFKSDENYEGTGFTFHYTTYQPDRVNDCNTSIVGGAGGKINNNPSSDFSCFYSIKAPAGQVVELRLTVIKFGSNTCDEEKLVVHNGPTTHAEVGKIWCKSNSSTPDDLSTMSQAVFIEYRNTIGSTKERFTMEYAFKDYEPQEDKPLPPSEVGGQPDCSELYENITSKVHEFPPYKDDKHCVVVVRSSVKPDDNVQVTFDQSFYLEESDDCIFDNLTMQSGETEDAPMLGGPYCGKSLGGRTFVTNGSSLRMVFNTDNSLSWFGARAEIRIVPQGSCDDALCKSGVCVLQGIEKVCMEGERCSTNTCANGGTCVEYKQTKQCYCPSGFAGDDCSQQLGPTKQHHEYCGISKHDEHDRHIHVEQVMGSRIFEGVDANANESPWFVALRTNLKKSNKKWTFCGGSLISRKHVLTAAHCVDDFYKNYKEQFNTSVQLLFGTVDCSISRTTRSPKRVVTHPKYNQIVKYDSDIAIIELDSPVEYNDAIRPICLQNENYIETMFLTQENTGGNVTGCGVVTHPRTTAKRLQTAWLPYINAASCEKLVNTWNKKKPNDSVGLTENMICAGFTNKDKSDACRGDSGGPYIMRSINTQQYQVGLVSFGPNCGKTDMPGFFTHTGRFFDWIKAETDFHKEQCNATTCDWLQ